MQGSIFFVSLIIGFPKLVITWRTTSPGPLPADAAIFLAAVLVVHLAAVEVHALVRVAVADLALPLPREGGLVHQGAVQVSPLANLGPAKRFRYTDEKVLKRLLSF